MKKSNTKTPVVFYVAIVLIVLVAISSSMTGGMYARYVTKDSSYDSARIAKYEIDDGFLKDVHTLSISDMRPGEEIEYSFYVKNKGEVAINFVVTATNVTNNLPIEIEKIDVDIAPGGQGTVVLKVTWPIKNVGGVSTDSDEFINKIDVITLNVKATQID